MNKQIEEMTRDFEDYACMSKFQAEIAAKAFCALGYRKSTDVVAEVLADVMFAVSKIVSEHIESDNSLLEAEVDIIHALTELKKKYESEGADDE